MSQHEGLTIGHAMAEIAADNAGSFWKEEAFEAFKQYARTNEEFTTEDVRRANSELSAPPDDRAWGHIALRAKREGIVKAAGWVRANSRTVHGMVVTKWRSQNANTGAGNGLDNN